MKKIISIFTMLFICGLIYSQNKLVKIMPNIGQGYLVLDKTVSKEISYFKVVLIHRVYEDDGTYRDYEENMKMDASNYIKFPSYAFSEEETYLFTVTAYGSNSEVIATEGPLPTTDKSCPGCGVYSKVSSKTCNGPTYAWEIKEHLNPNNYNAYYTLSQGVKYVDQQTLTYVPVYEYMTLESLTLLDGLNKEPYYGVNNFEPNGLEVVSLPNPNNQYRDKDNGVLYSSTVYGVQKYLGNWTGQGVQTDVMAINYSLANMDKYWWIKLMNESIDFSQLNNWHNDPMPDLSCEGGSIVTGVTIGSAWNNIYDCYQNAIHELGPLDYEHVDLIWLGFNSCMNNSISAYTITRLDSKADVIMVNQSDIFNPNGEYSGLKFSIEPGLYVYGFVFDDGSYYPVVTENKTRASFSPDLSDFLDVVIYPVPVVNNQFELKMNASAKVKFDYVLYDFYGTEIYRKNFVIQRDEERTFTVKPDVNIPSGILVNRFIFEDGSQKSLQTYKQ